MLNFYSHGKLLITSEYAVLDGAKALAFPTKPGQDLIVKSVGGNSLLWRSYDVDKQLWFESEFNISSTNFEILKTNDIETANTLVELLKTAQKMSDKSPNLSGLHIETHLEFYRKWGLGTSSTLINNLSSWFQINPYTLLENTFGGSGYDIACAQSSGPLVYQIKDGTPFANGVNIPWNFKDHLYFVYLNRKQNSRSGISEYRRKNKLSDEHLEQLNSITDQLLEITELEVFEALIREHNGIIGYLMGQEPIGSTEFRDFEGSVKNLGAWGGDFIMVSSKTDPRTYFKDKGFHTILSYLDLIK